MALNADTFSLQKDAKAGRCRMLAAKIELGNIGRLMVHKSGLAQARLIS